MHIDTNKLVERLVRSDRVANDISFVYICIRWMARPHMRGSWWRDTLAYALVVALPFGTTLKTTITANNNKLLILINTRFLFKPAWCPSRKHGEQKEKMVKLGIYESSG